MAFQHEFWEDRVGHCVPGGGLEPSAKSGMG